MCITSPCPDVADVEAEGYDVEVASNELGPFRSYRVLTPDKKAISIPVAEVGTQLIVRIVSKHEGAPPVNSNVLMVSAAPVAESKEFTGYGTSGDIYGGDITPDGAKATYNLLVQPTQNAYTFPLYISDLANDRVVSTKLIAQSAGGAAFSPNGTQLAYSSRTDNSFVIHDIASGNTRLLPIADATWVYGLDWSPDGKWLTYTTISNEEARLWKIPTSGGPAIALTPILLAGASNYIRRSALQWSSDGRLIAVSRYRAEASRNWRSVVSLYSSDGNGEVKYFETQPGWTDTNPSFSPDGNRLVFLSSRTDVVGDTYTIWVRDLVTNQVRQIRLSADQRLSYDYAPQWIGNNRLVYMAYAQGRRKYFTVMI